MATAPGSELHAGRTQRVGTLVRVAGLDPPPAGQAAGRWTRRSGPCRSGAVRESLPGTGRQPDRAQPPRRNADMHPAAARPPPGRPARAPPDARASRSPPRACDPAVSDLTSVCPGRTARPGAMTSAPSRPSSENRAKASRSVRSGVLSVCPSRSMSGHPMCEIGRRCSGVLNTATSMM